jgi:hypothetical protein
MALFSISFLWKTGTSTVPRTSLLIGLPHHRQENPMSALGRFPPDVAQECESPTPPLSKETARGGRDVCCVLCALVGPNTRGRVGIIDVCLPPRRTLKQALQGTDIFPGHTFQRNTRLPSRKRHKLVCRHVVKEVSRVTTLTNCHSVASLALTPAALHRLSLNCSRIIEKAQRRKEKTSMLASSGSKISVQSSCWNLQSRALPAQ